MNINETVSVWSRLEQTKKPIVIYGMGDGALKIMKVFAEKNIKLSDIFASDEYVRGHSFEGYKVLRYAEVCEKYDDFVIVVAFAVHDEPMMNRLYELSARHELYAPDVPVAGGGLFTPNILKASVKALKRHTACLPTMYHEKPLKR